MLGNPGLAQRLQRLGSDAAFDVSLTCLTLPFLILFNHWIQDECDTSAWYTAHPIRVPINGCATSKCTILDATNLSYMNPLSGCSTPTGFYYPHFLGHDHLPSDAIHRWGCNWQLGLSQRRRQCTVYVWVGMSMCNVSTSILAITHNNTI